MAITLPASPKTSSGEMKSPFNDPASNANSTSAWSVRSRDEPPQYPFSDTAPARPASSDWPTSPSQKSRPLNINTTANSTTRSGARGFDVDIEAQHTASTIRAPPRTATSPPSGVGEMGMYHAHEGQGVASNVLVTHRCYCERTVNLLRGPKDEGVFMGFLRAWAILILTPLAVAALCLFAAGAMMYGIGKLIISFGHIFMFTWLWA